MVCLYSEGANRKEGGFLSTVKPGYSYQLPIILRTSIGLKITRFTENYFKYGPRWAGKQDFSISAPSIVLPTNGISELYETCIY